MNQPAEVEIPLPRSLFHWTPFWFFIVLALVVSAIGYTTFQRNKVDTRLREMKLISTIADLKVEEIARWRTERKGDAENLAQGPFFSREVEKWLQKGMPPGESRSMILARMKSMRHAYDYRELFLLDARGNPLLSTSYDAPSPGSATLEVVKGAIGAQSITFLDISSHGELGGMGVIAPLLASHDDQPEAIGAIYLQIDPSQFLFRLLKAPLSGRRSMELVLVRREGNEVLFMNVPAANESVSLLRQPLSNSKLPAALAVSGMQGELEGVDYRGVPVFAALRKIPDSEWFLVVKVDQEESYTPLRDTASLVAGVIAILIALTGVAVGLWWRNQRAKSFIAEQRQYRIIIQTSLDGFWSNDCSGRIVDVNEAICQMLGYTREELLCMSIPDIEVSEAPEETAAHMQKIIQTGGDRFQTRHRRKDGTIIDMEISIQYSAELGERFFVFFRDITSSKQAERDIQRLNRLYNVLSRTNTMIIHAQDRQMLFDEACLIAVDHGTFRMAWIGVVDEATHLIKPLAMHGHFGDYLKKIRISVDDIPEGRGPTGTALREGRHFICRDIEHDPCMEPWREAALAMGYRSSAAFPLREGGTVKGVYTVYAPEVNWFTEEEIFLLDELASDISYALDALEKGNLRKQAEEEVRAASLYARSLIEASLDPLVTINADGKITDVNQATEQVTGRLRQQIIGSDFSEYFTEPEQARAGYLEVFARGRVTDYPLSIRHVSGKVTDVLYNATVYRDADGNIQGVFAAARDITERKKAEEMLHRIEWMLTEQPAETFPDAVGQDYGDLTGLNTSRVILDAVGQELLADIVGSFIHLLETSSAIYEKNGDYAFGIFSSGWCKFMDTASRQLCNTPDNREALRNGCWLCHESCWNEASRKSIETEAPADIECAGGIHLYALPIRAGDEIIGSINVGYGDPPKDEAGLQALAAKYNVSVAELRREAEAYQSRPPYIIDVARKRLFAAARLIGEIVQRKRTEEKIRLLNSELEQRVAERTAELEGFAYSVSHDLRVPLRAIDGFSNLILKRYEEKLDDEGKRLLNVVRDNSRKMGQLIDDILAFSRTGRLELRSGQTDMEALAHSVWQELEQSLAKREVRLEIKPLPVVQGDAAMLRQVWVNLLGNAVKFTHPRAIADIEVGGLVADNTCTFYVKDNGVGFDQQYVDKLFGVFQRLHGVEDFEGTGIGLAIVKRIINRHGGQVWAEGHVNEGATFYFTLPLREGQS